MGELEKEAARWKLAERLWREMERLDPVPEAPQWDCMPDFDRRFYYHCVMALLMERQLVLTACP